MVPKKFNKLLKEVKCNLRAFTELYTYYFPKVVFFITNKYRDTQLGEDVAQDLFIKLFDIQYEYINNPLAWLYTLADNAAKNMLKKKSREELVPNFDAVEYKMAANQEESDQIIFGKYFKRLEKLDFQSRDIVLKHVFENYSFKDIANETGLKYEAVRQRYHRSIVKLRKD